MRITPWESWPARFAPTSASPISFAMSSGAPAPLKIPSVTAFSWAALRLANSVLPLRLLEDHADRRGCVDDAAGRLEASGRRVDAERHDRVAVLVAREEVGPARIEREEAR